MRKLEETAGQNLRRTKVQEAILLTLATASRIGTDLLLKQALDRLLGTDFSTTPPRRSEIVKSAASRLTKKGLVVYKDGYHILTKAGKGILDKWHMSRYEIRQPKKWDKRWRIIIFDIPENKKLMRDQARNILREAGFQRLQDSVWVYPYDCEDVIGLMKIDLGIGKYLLYIIADQIENDRFLRMDFDLIK